MGRCLNQQSRQPNHGVLVWNFIEFLYEAAKWPQDFVKKLKENHPILSGRLEILTRKKHFTSGHQALKCNYR